MEDVPRIAYWNGISSCAGSGRMGLGKLAWEGGTFGIASLRRGEGVVGGVEKAPWAARGTQLPLGITHWHSILQGRVTLQQGSATRVRGHEQDSWADLELEFCISQNVH